MLTEQSNLLLNKQENNVYDENIQKIIEETKIK